MPEVVLPPSGPLLRLQGAGWVGLEGLALSGLPLGPPQHYPAALLAIYGCGAAVCWLH